MRHFGIAIIPLLILSACDKKSGEAVVLSKEHIAAREVTPTPEPTASPTATPSEQEELKEVPTAPDEIVVDTLVMKKLDRGTGRDPRALTDEQWLVRVELVNGGREFNVHATRAQFEKLKEGDHVQVSYRVGRYTGTVWGSEIQ